MWIALSVIVIVAPTVIAAPGFLIKIDPRVVIPPITDVIRSVNEAFVYFTDPDADSNA
jgi:hypothetical protein